MTSEDRCNNCKHPLPIHMLDAKPPQLAGKQTTWAMLYAAKPSADWTVLECRECYGPAWEEGARS